MRFQLNAFNQALAAQKDLPLPTIPQALPVQLQTIPLGHNLIQLHV